MINLFDVENFQFSNKFLINTIIFQNSNLKRCYKIQKISVVFYFMTMDNINPKDESLRLKNDSVFWKGTIKFVSSDQARDQ